jgi:hypothetical protein
MADDQGVDRVCGNEIDEVLEGQSGEEEVAEEQNGNGEGECEGELCIQHFLRSGGSLEAVTDHYGVLTRRHPTHQNLVLFKYQQRNSPFSKQLVRECRGLILDEDDDWRVVSYPYKKFFNYNEKYAASIDWETAKVWIANEPVASLGPLTGAGVREEGWVADDRVLLQGAIQTRLHSHSIDPGLFLPQVKGKWEVATSGRPGGDGDLPGSSGPFTFASLFWDTWNTLGYEMPRNTDTYGIVVMLHTRMFERLTAVNRCYMFELMSPLNPIVVVPQGASITLHGARHLPSLRELDPEQVAAEHGWQVVKRCDAGCGSEGLKQLTSVQGGLPFVERGRGSC